MKIYVDRGVGVHVPTGNFYWWVDWDDHGDGHKSRDYFSTAEEAEEALSEFLGE